MLHVYRLLAGRIGTADAIELAQDLAAWHDTMVLHERAQTALGAQCSSADDCPHTEARDLWSRARKTFGPDAERLTFLRTSAGFPTGATA
jgi:hypothetical protein